MSWAEAIALLFLALLTGSPWLRADPTGGQVVGGVARIGGSVGSTTITQTSDRAIINWQGFSTAPGQSISFVQPSASSATLNRVISGAPSALLGSLTANGEIFLINPNGVLVGAGARIDTAGFSPPPWTSATPNFSPAATCSSRVTRLPPC